MVNIFIVPAVQWVTGSYIKIGYFGDSDNQQQIQAQLQQMQQQYHSQQMWKVSDCAKKLDDFLKNAEEIDAQYQQLAFTKMVIHLNGMKKYLKK